MYTWTQKHARRPNACMSEHTTEHTRSRSSAQPTRACTHILSQGELVTVWTPENIYIERNERIMKSTDRIFTNIQWQTVYLSHLKLSHINRKKAVWTSITLLCPVNLPNEEKLAGWEKLARGGSQDKEKLLTNASSPSLRRWTCNS